MFHTRAIYSADTGRTTEPLAEVACETQSISAAQRHRLFRAQFTESDGQYICVFNEKFLAKYIWVLLDMRQSIWLYVLIGIALIRFGWSLAGTVFLDGVMDAGGGVVALYAIFGLLGLLLVPVFFIALYLDAGTVRKSSSPWNPDRRFWVGGGIVISLLSYAVAYNPSIEIIAAVYLFYRFRNPSPKDSNNDPHIT